MLKHIILIVLYGWTLNINSQDTLTKTNSFGLGFCFSGASNTPSIANAPFIFFKSKKHEIFLGLDFYNMTYSTGVILGPQAGYKYYFRNPDKIFNIYFVANLQYVQFGQGTTWAVPYNYLPTDNEHKDRNLLRTRSFSNTYGAGISLTFLKRFYCFLDVSGGYNYSETSYSPTNDNKYGIYGIEPTTKIIFTPFIKLGLGCKIHKW